MMVSVCMITYNQEAYISQAIEGVLMQKADFQIKKLQIFQKKNIFCYSPDSHQRKDDNFIKTGIN